MVEPFHTHKKKVARRSDSGFLDERFIRTRDASFGVDSAMPCVGHRGRVGLVGWEILPDDSP